MKAKWMMNSCLMKDPAFITNMKKIYDDDDNNNNNNNNQFFLYCR